MYIQSRIPLNYGASQPMHYHPPTPIPDTRLAGPCGLFCSSCKVYIATRDQAAIRKSIAESLYLPKLSLECNGCRSNSRHHTCKECHIRDCAALKGLDFCGECSDYPCEKLSEFQTGRPHCAELFANQDRILEAGFETWFQEMNVRYACPECSTINSAYHLSCHNCRTTPSCAFVTDHKAEIVAYLSSSSRPPTGPLLRR
jgi:hypothetical protein